MSLRTRIEALAQGVGADVKELRAAVLSVAKVEASTATPTPERRGGKHSKYHITALAVNAVFAAPTGIPADGDSIVIRIKDNGTARTLGWDSIYRAVVPLPVTTVLNETLYVAVSWNNTDGRWDVMAVTQGIPGENWASGAALMRSRGRYRGYSDLRSQFAPSAMQGRRVMASPPTVAQSGTNPGSYQAIDLSAISPTVHKRITTLAGADWVQAGAGAGWWASHNSAVLGDTHRSPASVMIGTDSTVVSFHVRSWPGHKWRLRVDYGDGLGWQYVSAVNGTTGASNASFQYISVTFPDNAIKRVRMDAANADIHGVWTASSSDSVWAPKPRGPRVAVMGDSFTDSSGDAPTGYNYLASYVWMMADLLGWEDVISAGSGGMGWVQGTQNFQSRASRVAAWGADIDIFAGGRNDFNASAASITAAVTATLDTVRAGSPDALILVLGPFSTGDPVDGSVNTSWAPVQTAIFAGLSAVHRAITIDTVASGIFTGTGKAGTAGTGNGNRFVQADGVHPTQVGADYLGWRLASKIFEALSAA